MEEESSDSIHSFHDRYEYDFDRSYAYDSDGYYEHYGHYVPTNNSDKEEEEQQQQQSSHDHRTKCRKHAPTLEDRISTLPESILISILSLLTTKQAIKTNALSKRWAHIWTSVPSLDFDSYRFQNTANFATVVSDALLLHEVPPNSQISPLPLIDSNTSHTYGLTLIAGFISSLVRDLGVL